MAKTASDYLAAIQTIRRGYHDSTWSPSANAYLSNGLPELSGNVHNLINAAVLASRGLATETDKSRARSTVAQLITAPAYQSNTWRQILDGTGGTHPARDEPAALSLYYAYKYRTELGIDSTTAAAIIDILTVDRASGCETWARTLDVSADGSGAWNNQNLADWKLNRIIYAHLLGVDQTSRIRLCASRFLQYAGAVSPSPNQLGDYAPWLSADFGWRYINAAPWQSFEYGAMCFGKFGLMYPEAGAAMALTDPEKATVKAWGRHILGQWGRSGYPNWDTVWSDMRGHTMVYWVWALTSLMSIARNPSLNMGANDHLYAKWMLDKAVDTFTRTMDTWNSDAADGSAPQYPYGTVPHFESTFDATTLAYYWTKEIGSSKFAAYLALAVDLGIADLPSEEPGNLFGWGWTQKHIHVTTPAYDAASLPSAPRITGTFNIDWGADAVQLQHWGLSRLALPNSEVLTALGGYGQEAFSFITSRDGSTDLDTSATEPTTQQVHLDGVLQTRTDYDTSVLPSEFASTLRNFCSKPGTNYRTEVDTTFRPDRITLTHRAVLTGAAGHGQMVMSVPARKRGSHVTMEYVAIDDTVTTVWDGTTIVPAGSPDPSVCKEIRLVWSDGAIITLRPVAGTLGPGAKVTALGSYPNSYPRRQPDQDRSLLIYLADSTSSDVGSVELTFDVTVSDGATVLPGVFTYRPVVTLVTPPLGPATGGTSVTITGAGFTGASGATFGGVAATDFTVVNDTTITCVTPAHAAGVVDVVVTVDGITGTLAAGFTYAFQPAGRRFTTRALPTGSTDYGLDVSTIRGLDPTFTLIGERRAIAEVYARMLQTPRGSLFYAPSRGTDVRAWMNARVKDAGTLARWRHEVEAEGERDERIESASATLTWNQRTGELRIAVAVQSAAGPFTMVLAVTSLTLNILEVQ